MWVQSLVRKIPWRREWQPTPVILPGEFHGQRSPAVYSPWGHKESDTTEWVHACTHTHFCLLQKISCWQFQSCSPALIDFDFSPGCLFQPATGQTPLQSWSGGRSCSCGAPGFPCRLVLALNPIPVRTEAKGALQENWRALVRWYRGCQEAPTWFSGVVPSEIECLNRASAKSISYFKKFLIQIR